MAVPEVVILRLPLYMRALSRLVEEKVEVVSSQELGNRLQLTPAQIRKDLSYFGRFGKQGKGYNVRRLLVELKRILQLDREWSMALMGVGRLGRAILNYGGFSPQGFKIIAAFDTDPAQVGKKAGNLTVQDISELGTTIASRGISIGIVAVPPAQAQKIINILAENGIRAILNYVPVALRVPKDVRMREIDPVIALQSMTFYLKSPNKKDATSLK